MIRHPDGSDGTKRLLSLSELVPPAKILDLGCGDGETILQLLAEGFQAIGVDIKEADPENPAAPYIKKEDLLHTSFSDEAFDACISECTLFMTGNRKGALTETARILKKGGRLLYGDVWFGSEDDVKEEQDLLFQECGFSILKREDITRQWQAYYIQSIFDGTFECPSCSFPKKGCRYYSLICGKL